MWLARCWGQAVSSGVELEVGGGCENSEEGDRESEAEPNKAWEQRQTLVIACWTYI